MFVILRNVSTVLFLFILAAMPLGIHDQQGKIVFDWNVMFSTIRQFFEGLSTGEAWTYRQGDRNPSIMEDLVSPYFTSFSYLLVSAIIVILLSIWLGIFLSKRTRSWVDGIVGLAGIIPDFIVVLLLQLLVVFIYQSTGVKTFKVASSSAGEPAVFLPILTLVIIPLFYLVRSLGNATSDVTSEDYILMAKSKGFSKRYINFYHVTSNVLPTLKADLHKVMSIMIGNLFIVEYLYNTRGMTTLLFLTMFRFGYQYNLVIFCLLAFMTLYFVCFFVLRLFIAALERKVSF
ncbi:ABC transporter permease subunit [Pseudalkalibacillus sp. SCS-8]|uniref:ABC transporter permease subunit n=1 Tax=Pseudalkalibacillus nanhaiensis TaxID=3115291 RepID=UPI0032DA55CD